MRTYTKIFIFILLYANCYSSAQLTKLFHFKVEGNWGKNGCGQLVCDSNWIYGVGKSCNIFKIKPDGSNFTVLKKVNYLSGLLVKSDSFLYSTTQSGTIFKIKIDGTGFKELIFIDYLDGGNLVIKNDTIYGVSNSSKIFKLKTDGTGYSVIYEMNNINKAPVSLTIENNLIYVTNPWGGPMYSGNIFTIHKDGTGFKNLINFGDNIKGAYPFGPMLFVDSFIYGFSGLSRGVLYRLNRDGTNYSIIKEFLYNDIFDFAGSLLKKDTLIYGIVRSGNFSPNAFSYLFKMNKDGSGFKKLHDFDITIENSPGNNLQLLDSCLYGSTDISEKDSYGGFLYKYNLVTNENEIIFRNGYSQTGNGSQNCKLVSDGTWLYGTTARGGKGGGGVVFKLKKNGTEFTVLKEFTSPASGWQPTGSLVVVNDSIYGTTYYGGNFKKGNIYKLNKDGSGFIVIHEFDSIKGEFPTGDLVLNGNNIYGLTFTGGAYGKGTVFSIQTNGLGFKTIKNSVSYLHARLVTQNSCLYFSSFSGLQKMNLDGTNFTNYYHQGAWDFILSEKSYLYFTDFSNFWSIKTDKSASKIIHNDLKFNPVCVFNNTIYLASQGELYRMGTDGSDLIKYCNYNGVLGGGLLLDGCEFYGITVSEGDYDAGYIFKIRPGIYENAKSIEVCDGRSTSFSLKTDAYKCTYRWQQIKGLSLVWTDIIAKGTSPEYAGWFTDSLILNNNSINNNGNHYRCIISDECANIQMSDTVELIVNNSLPEIIEQPKFVYDNDSNGIWSINVKGGLVHYHWQTSLDSGKTWVNGLSNTWTCCYSYKKEGCACDGFGYDFISLNIDTSFIKLTKSNFYEHSIYRCMIHNSCDTVMSDAFSENGKFVSINNNIISKINIYPNPASGFIYLTSPAFSNFTGQTQILDCTGRLIHSQTLPATQQGEEISIDLSGHANGMYLVKLSIGGKLYYGKILLKH